MVEATKTDCGFDRDNLNKHTDLPTYKKPSKAMRMGGEFRQLAALKKAVGLERSDQVMVSEAEAFLYLVDTFWNVKVSSVALKTRDAQKYDKKELLPLTSDLTKFTKTMKKRLATMVERGIHSQEDYNGHHQKCDSKTACVQ